VRDDSLVRDAQRQMQEPKRIEHRQLALQKAIGEHALSDLCGNLAVRVTAHAIARDQQRCILRHGHGNAILIALTSALQAQFRTFDPQASSEAFRYTSPRFIHQ